MKKIAQYSWGRYPQHPQTLHRVYWHDELVNKINQLTKIHENILPFGNGRSYGDSCLAVSDQIIALQSNRFIEVDWQTGLIRADASVTIDQLLQLIIPRGWFIPVTPGTKYVTLGGAVANDVHGKNHHVRGTIGRYIKSFGLQRSDLGLLECSTDKNAKLYQATIGGLGLTGFITWVEMQLLPITSSNIDVRSLRFTHLEEFFAMSSELDSQYEYSVAWLDCNSKEKKLGRGLYKLGKHSQDRCLLVKPNRSFNFPIIAPVSLINAYTAKIFNAAYYHKQYKRVSTHKINYNTYFYPLDKLLNWNRIYGKHGLQQYQCVLPTIVAQESLKDILQVISASKRGSFLAVLKRCGDLASPGLLSFPMPGITLALDFRQHDLKNAKLFSQLNTIVHEAGGRIYPAKDAQMESEAFRKAYPAWEQLEALRDPVLLSRFWQRVTQ